MAADVAVQPAGYTLQTGTPAPTSTLDLPVQIPATAVSPMQVTDGSNVMTVGWRRPYRAYYGPGYYRPYYRPYYYRPYRPYYGYGYYGPGYGYYYGY